MTLNDYLTQSGTSNAEFGALIGLTRNTIYNLRMGIKRPKWETLILIQDLTKGRVRPNDFAPPVKEFVSPAERAAA